jgi:lantibiotic biosynthesis protein
MSSAGEAYLDVANAIARHIAGSAVWHDSRCTWIGALPEEGQGGMPSMAYRSLGPDLYGGTAGVGLFLAETASVSQDQQVRATAIGALQHSHLHSLKPSVTVSSGLYSGSLGVAYSLARSAQVLREPRLLDAAHDVARRIVFPASTTGSVECDLMSGLAGGVVGLLLMARMLGDSRYSDRAVNCADQILTHAKQRDDAFCWPSTLMPQAPALLGLSHGASGIGLALLEAALATGESRFTDAARRAFEYERSLYSADARNWPDLRHSSPDRPAQHSFATYWCHGAPGIALARIRAAELGADDFIRSEALTALETTRTFVRQTLDTGHANFSLCHGLCGNAEILTEGRRILDDGSAAHLAEEVAIAGSRAYAGNPELWPCGAQGGTTPALFLGLAGIGHFYLRLAQPLVPSVLLFRP